MVAASYATPSNGPFAPFVHWTFIGWRFCFNYPADSIMEQTLGTNIALQPFCLVKKVDGFQLG
jgi:hypothetical protein